MEKTRFVIIGSGWRSLYYVRIARALPDLFEVCAMLCRTQEKADMIQKSHQIYATTSIEECRKMKPDFVVVAVSKKAIAEVSMEWLSYGFPVLCETPAALDEAVLSQLWRLHKKGGRLAVAEQYTHYPVYQAMIRVLDSDLIGEPYNATVSLAHDYHGASLIRAFLRTDMQPFQVSGRSFSFPTTETMTRYEQIRDGRVSQMSRSLATIEFEDGKVAFYDFNGAQYRSPIRNNYVNVQGCRGEMKDILFSYLDAFNLPHADQLLIKERTVITEDKNPNLGKFQEITQIQFCGKKIYEPPFGICGLSEDETAIGQLLADMAAYVRGEREEPGYPLKEALQDAYMSILLRKAIKYGKTVKSDRMPWHENGI